MILDGKKLSEEIISDLAIKIEENNYKIKLVIIKVGNDPASNIYIRQKKKAADKVGVKCLILCYQSISEEELISKIKELNSDETVTGIILQSPTPGINYDKVCNYIDSSKDVDGFTKNNIYNLYLGRKGIVPCTVKGIIRLLKEYKINLSGANALIIGRGKIVGKPLALTLNNEDATVTLAHSRTRNLKELIQVSEIIISAVGKKHLITEDMVSDKHIIVDVGVVREEGKIYGDCDFDNLVNKVKGITPNPKGVGPMTVAMIIDNLVEIEEVKSGR